MAKPTKHAPLICIILTILSILGIVLGVIFSNALFIIILLIPAVAYEVYRTEGESTRWSSSILLIILLFEVYLVFTHSKLNLSKFIDLTNPQAKIFLQTFGNLKILSIFSIMFLAFILFKNTFGVFTKWLSVIIIISCIVTVYTLDKQIFNTIINYVVNSSTSFNLIP